MAQNDRTRFGESEAAFSIPENTEKNAFTSSGCNGGSPKRTEMLECRFRPLSMKGTNLV